MAAEVTTLSDLPWIDDNSGGGGRLDMTWAERIKDPDSDLISEF